MKTKQELHEIRFDLPEEMEASVSALMDSPTYEGQEPEAVMQDLLEAGLQSSSKEAREAYAALPAEDRQQVNALIQALFYMQEHPEAAPAGRKERYTVALRLAGLPENQIAEVLDRVSK